MSLISGLDRKVHVSVRKSGTEVYSTTTDSIKVSDRIKASTGEEFYGKIITLPPLSDGPYQVISEILNTQGAMVDSTTQDFTIDSVGPTADDLSILQKPGYEMVTQGERWELGLGADQKLIKLHYRLLIPIIASIPLLLWTMIAGLPPCLLHGL
ncbi:hypothetical protein DD584_18505 [Klebsiella pneumoniae]|nr:hypothetical protein DD584_18505 [Klebsiella pneumoniae]